MVIGAVGQSDVNAREDVGALRRIPPRKGSADYQHVCTFWSSPDTRSRVKVNSWFGVAQTSLWTSG